jgi:chaperonin cofactor prefoldin
MMMAGTVEEFTQLRDQARELRETMVRLTTEKERAERDLEEAERTLTELGFDVDGDIEAQLTELRQELEGRLDELREALA